MARQNRVLPTGEIVAHPARGTMMGNRGILHDAHGQLGRARWRHPHWICCVLDFRNRQRPIMQPGRYTELFFLDEAVALAAGHRPCAECRRADYLRFRAIWEAEHGTVANAAALDRALHDSRVTRSRAQIRHAAPFRDLPDGAFVLMDGTAQLVLGDALHPFSPSGYGAPAAKPSGQADVLTPAPVITVLKAGFRPILHPSVAF
jgi:hypothetical protein